MRKSTLIIEDFVDSLEKLIDTLDDEWSANKEGRWRQANDIRERVLPVAKDKFKQYLDEYIDRRIETYCEQHHIQRTTFTEE